MVVTGRDSVHVPMASLDLLVQAQEVAEVVRQQVNQNTATTTDRVQHSGQNRVNDGPCLDPDYK
jgi:hypothetical protein